MALLVMTFLVPAAQAADDKAALRERALKLNTITGTDPADGGLALTKDAEGTKESSWCRRRDGQGQRSTVQHQCYLHPGTGCTRIERGVNGRGLLSSLHGTQALKPKSGGWLTQAYGGLIDLFYANKKFDEVEKLCREVMNQGDESVGGLKAIALEVMIEAINKQGRTEEAIKMVDKRIKQEPSNWKLLRFKGLIQYQADRYEQAAKSFEEVLECIKEDKDLSEKEKTRNENAAYYRLSGIYVDLNQIDKAAEQLNLSTQYRSSMFQQRFRFDWGYQRHVRRKPRRSTYYRARTLTN